ncbi:helix-turn-helix domain-containing protein [Thalassobaculum sp. OXR-137]|uniref:helix-turn-helix domain-containing protein n=1 Tax=Thalassobaculum sp. OXR-137 TaxID=3100173 RepID=UPI002AC937E2|nr:helix-turn-helix domain-containing protein [Thalassobaculum sp. OXR-137]WPZ34918.1 helix-turn-helix domain-containing protein [Thalassobaculum sp. OXR-137]
MTVVFYEFVGFRAGKKAAAMPDAPFANRLAIAIGDESVSSFSRRCEIGEASIRQYLKGSAPSIDKAAAIADAAGVSIEWLATGRGEMRSSNPQVLPEDEIDRRLLEIRETLMEHVDLPVSADALGHDDALWPIYVELQSLARGGGASGAQRAEADLYLRTAFDDRGADRRMEQRVKDVGVRIRAAYAAVDEALAAVGWTPSPLFKEQLRTVAFRHEMTVEDLTLLSSAVRDEVAAATAPSKPRPAIKR